MSIPNNELTNAEVLSSVEPGDLLIVCHWCDANTDKPIVYGVKETRSRIVKPKLMRKIYLICSRINVPLLQQKFNYLSREFGGKTWTDEVLVDAVLLGEGNLKKTCHILKLEFNGYYQIIKCAKNRRSMH